ncbi:metal ABC transporter ATP-binding protein [Pseudonocardia abyssalis]|uniref:Metal ABC transporter ATP-binding protein n=1 Tax=Pseudonocardia abyssalis TaxID=2792008 RepID=A0ABS6UWY6_9PSEU|nr:metal ABC transporter ATP-binding protein [Pseudonocardia abyssalis]MBW0118625.1 metal ABC transporter ATP-binding protein [Pseudonocardia abyssalis]MBW0136731.1 metal ABC transporter ATP-binding protein [Pseudonocardia abyssalis]
MAARTTHALEIGSLTVSYRSAPVLWEVDAHFPAGQLCAIVGPNGAGKSTLLKAALGLVPADAGRVAIDGVEGKAALDRVAYVPQRESVDWDFPITVAEVVAMGRYRATGWFRRIGRADRAIAAQCLERVGMAAYGRRQIGQLSGGQRQRVFLARALAQQAPVLVMDEPFAGIDARTQSDLLALLGGIRDDGGSVVVVHHDMAQVRASFDWTLLLNVRALGCGPTAEVLTSGAVRSAYGVPDDAVAWAG